ncbi:MAG TPA: ABC transporter permease [Bryobacteraceae bacterium]|nr:ABC transporter permease [Bryobacteraceae bacterium]
MALRDVFYAGRTLRKSPVFAATAVLTIALGVGASTAIFSVTNAVLLRPLSYKDPDRLVFACGDMRKRDVKDFPFSSADYFDLRDGTKKTFDGFAALNTGPALLTTSDGTPERVRTAQVTPNFFRLMGAKVELGRDFQESDGQAPLPAAVDGAPGAVPAAAPALPAMVILSHEYWQRRFGSDRGVIGRKLDLGAPGGAEIVGVLSPGFELVFPPSFNIEPQADVWTAVRRAYNAANRNNVEFQIIGRMKPGVTLQAAQTEVEGVAADINSKEPIRVTAGFAIRLEPMQQYVVAKARPAILALMGAVIFLLLIACANVANLVLVRASSRARELAVRTALGANWWRIAGQMLTEAFLLAAMGSVLGLGLAWFGIRELLVIAPASLPRLDAVHIDLTVVGFTVLAGIIAAALFGLVPAWKASRPDVITVLRASGRTASLSGSRVLRNGVVVAEVALSFVLLIGSGLMFRSFLELQRIDPGFDSHNLLTFALLGGAAPAQQQRSAQVRLIHETLSSISGVRSVTAATPFPLADLFSPIRWGREDALADASTFKAADIQIVLPGYFETMRTPLVEGRVFTEADNDPKRNVVIVDQALAAAAFPTSSAVGKRILIRARTAQPEWVEILGVVKHQRDVSLAEAGRAQIYVTDGFLSYGVVGRWAVRTSSDPAAYVSVVRAEIARIAPRAVVSEVLPMQAYLEKSAASTWFTLLLIGVFATIAVVLASVGLYGVLATVVRQRTSEIGVRMAMGAAPTRIFGLVVGHGMRLSAAGIAIGFAAALVLTRAMNSMLVGVKSTDPLTFGAIAVFFLAVAAVSCWVPARRAAGLDPTEALRQD